MTFKEIFADFQATAPDTYKRELEKKSMSVLPALIDLSGNERMGVRLLGTFVLGAAMADGELVQAEYDLLEPMFYTFFGEELSFEESKILVKNMINNGDLLQKVDEMVDFFGRFNQKLKADVVMICLMICAVDGVVTESEKQWIAQLVF